MLESISKLKRKNASEVCLKGAELLLKYSNNVLCDPFNEKFRKINKENKNIMKILGALEGGKDCLVEMGFKDKGDCFLFDDDSFLESLEEARDQLETLMKDLIKINKETPTAGPSTVEIPKPIPHSKPKVHKKKFKMLATVSEEAFYNEINQNFKRMKVYEDEKLQEKAREFIGVNRLKKKVEEKMKEEKAEKEEFEDFLLIELLHWFKREFFSWMNSPSCPFCGSTSTSSIGNLSPSIEEIKDGALRVEGYKCSQCSSQVRFPRFNNPGKLLETRVGRCGEWANCFTLCCRALGFQARHVMDFQDHVWVEVFSRKQQRWLHCDPCEDVCDKPLLYEKGWGKKLNYVVACSHDDIQDVSWRYSGNHREMRGRRSKCREEWLAQVIHKMRLKRFEELKLDDKERKNKLKITLCELVEMMLEKQEGEKLGGRTSGSEEWRRKRGEMGKEIEGVLIQPNQEEIKQNQISIKYSVNGDYYLRGMERVKSWKSLVFQFKEIIRKEEYDWKKVYICRSENSLESSISWKISILNLKKKIEKLKILIKSQSFETGKISWLLSNEDNMSVNLTPSNDLQDFSPTFENSQVVLIQAKLNGGKGSNHWQQTQLFREDMKEEGKEEEDSFPFQMILTLKNSES